jgi:hypothetical protein
MIPSRFFEIIASSEELTIAASRKRDEVLLKIGGRRIATFSVIQKMPGADMLSESLRVRGGGEPGKNNVNST